MDQLGQFLNPHLASILALLLRRGMVQDNSLPGHRPDLIVEVASAIRERVPAVIPPRLLLPALVAHLDSALHVSFTVHYLRLDWLEIPGCVMCGQCCVQSF